MRVQAGENCRAAVTPQSLHEIGQQAILEAIKLYRDWAAEVFDEFADDSRAQAMVLAKNACLFPIRTPKAGPDPAAVLE